MLLLAVVVVFASVFSVQGQLTTNVAQCTQHIGALPANTYIEGCIDPPCLLPLGQNVVVNIVFRAPQTMESMRTLATAYLSLGIITLPVPYPLGDDAFTCNFLGNSFCPVMEGEVLQYTLKMFIDDAFPVNTNAVIEFRVVNNANNTPFICIRVPISIIPAVEGRSRNSTTIH